MVSSRLEPNKLPGRNSRLGRVIIATKADHFQAAEEIFVVTGLTYRQVQQALGQIPETDSRMLRKTDSKGRRVYRWIGPLPVGNGPGFFSYDETEGPAPRKQPESPDGVSEDEEFLEWLKYKQAVRWGETSDKWPLEWEEWKKRREATRIRETKQRRGPAPRGSVPAPVEPKKGSPAKPADDKRRSPKAEKPLAKPHPRTLRLRERDARHKSAAGKVYGGMLNDNVGLNMVGTGIAGSLVQRVGAVLREIFGEMTLAEVHEAIVCSQMVWCNYDRDAVGEVLGMSGKAVGKILDEADRTVR